MVRDMGHQHIAVHTSAKVSNLKPTERKKKKKIIRNILWKWDVFFFLLSFYVIQFRSHADNAIWSFLVFIDAVNSMDEDVEVLALKMHICSKAKSS